MWSRLDTVRTIIRLGIVLDPPRRTDRSTNMARSAQLREHQQDRERSLSGQVHRPERQAPIRPAHVREAGGRRDVGGAASAARSTGASGRGGRARNSSRSGPTRCAGWRIGTYRAGRSRTAPASTTRAILDAPPRARVRAPAAVARSSPKDVRDWYERDAGRPARRCARHAYSLLRTIFASASPRS